MAVFDVSFLNPNLNPRYSDNESGCVSISQEVFELCKQSFQLKQQSNILRQNQDATNNFNATLDNLNSQITNINSRIDLIETNISSIDESQYPHLFYQTLIILNSFLFLAIIVVFLFVIKKRNMVN